MGRLIFVIVQLPVFVRLQNCLRGVGVGCIAPFYSIDDKHPHPSNVFRGCKVLYPRAFKVSIQKNAQWHNHEKKKEDFCGIKMGRVMSACVPFGFYS